jgi:Rrf2 family protein
MLRISRRADYAVRVMIAVAARPEGVTVPAPQIGQAMLIPQPFLAKVVGDLKRSGLVSTAPGRAGGLMLAQPAATITLRQIVESVDGPIMLNACLTRSGECPRDALCPAHPVWGHIQKVLCGVMEGVSLAELAAAGLQSGYVTHDVALDGDGY